MRVQTIFGTAYWPDPLSLDVPGTRHPSRAEHGALGGDRTCRPR